MLGTGCGTWSPPPTRSPVRRRHKSRPKPGRSQYVMEEKIIGRLGDLIRTWRMRHEIDSANAGIATAIPITSIVDAELDPRRYQKRPHTDITAIQERVQELRRKVSSDATQVHAAVTDLIQYLGGRNDSTRPSWECGEGIERSRACQDD